MSWDCPSDRRVGFCTACPLAAMIPGEWLTRWLGLQAGELQRAVDCCVHLNHWDQAVDLARQHSLPQIETLLAQYAGRLLEDKRTLEAVQLYRKASDQLDSPSCPGAAASAEGCRGPGALCLERFCRRGAKEEPSRCC